MYSSSSSADSAERPPLSAASSASSSPGAVGSASAFDTPASALAEEQQQAAHLRAALQADDKANKLDIPTLLSNADKLKKACRGGIPMEQRARLWQACIDKHADVTPLDYAALKREVFADAAHPTHFPHHPDFGSSMKWHDASIPLTSTRLHQAKSLLCVLAINQAGLSHCPLLPDLACMLLMFYEEETTFHLLTSLLTRSRQDELFLTTRGADWLRWMKTFEILLQRKNEALYKHMRDTLKLDAGKLFSVWLSRCFVHYLPYRVVFRVLDAFFNEGNKILFRVGLAVLKLHTKKLLQCTSHKEFLRTLHRCMMAQPPDELMNAAFDLYLSRTSHIRKIHTHIHENHTRLLSNPPDSVHTSTFHLPRFSPQFDHVSTLINVDQLYSLWSWLPPKWRICDPIMLYASEMHGYSYDTLVKRSCEHAVGANTPIFMLLQTSDQRVLGLYLHRPLPDPVEFRRMGNTGNSGGMSLYTGHASDPSATTTNEPLDAHTFLFELTPGTRAKCWKHWIMRGEEKARMQRVKANREQLHVEEPTKGATSALSSASLSPQPTSHIPSAVPTPTPTTMSPAPPSSSHPPPDTDHSHDPESRSFKPYGLDKHEHEEWPGAETGIDEEYEHVSHPPLSIHIETPEGGMRPLHAHAPQTTRAAHSSAAQRARSDSRDAHGRRSSMDGGGGGWAMVDPSGHVQETPEDLNELYGELAISPRAPLRQNNGGMDSASSAFSPTARSAFELADELQGASPLPTRTPTTPGQTPVKGSLLTPAGLQVNTSASKEALSPNSSAANHTPSLTRTDSSSSSSSSPVPSLSSFDRGEAMLLMSDEGFGLVETGGLVLFLSSDLKTVKSRPSRVFESPSLANSDAPLGQVAVTAIEVWSFATPGSEAIEQLSPSPQHKLKEKQLKLQQQKQEEAASPTTPSLAPLQLQGSRSLSTGVMEMRHVK